MLLLRSNLRLLLAQLDGLAETPYFSSELDAYIRELRDALAKLLSKVEESPPTINLDVAQFISNEVWRLTQFLTGSTAKQIPYEVVFAIKRAAQEWGTDDLLITTAIVQEANFYFHGSSRDFFDLVERELGVKINARPVQIALPYVYRHKPLFCVPLFHEFGHFVDADNEIVTTSLLNSPAHVGPDLPDVKPSAEIGGLSGEERKFWESVVRNHRMEYFADLVSVAYVGKAAQGFLQEFIPNNRAEPSHPSSASRFQLMTDFINGKSNPILDLFQDALVCRGLPRLTHRFSNLDVEETFGNVRPCQLASDQEVFGIFDAGWSFLQQMATKPSGAWSALSEAEIERIANDLTEKSIRNMMIREGWNAALNP
ncbi:MAG: hypothetical protein M0Z73_13150 [Betaproteobacteria bacterium]|nr:hypothetical protein [Betaproteobacteria bacterium]